MQDTIERMGQECRRALACLYIAAESPVAKDVNDKTLAYIAALEQHIQELQAERDAARGLRDVMAQRVRELEAQHSHEIIVRYPY